MGLGTGLLGLVAAMERRADAMQEGRRDPGGSISPHPVPPPWPVQVLRGAAAPVNRAAIVVRMRLRPCGGAKCPHPQVGYETLGTVTSTIEVHLKPSSSWIPSTSRASYSHECDIANGFTTGQPICKAGIDSALHDLICKASNIRLADL